MMITAGVDSDIDGSDEDESLVGWDCRHGGHVASGMRWARGRNGGGWGWKAGSGEGKTRQWDNEKRVDANWNIGLWLTSVLSASTSNGL